MPKRKILLTIFIACYFVLFNSSSSSAYSDFTSADSTTYCRIYVGEERGKTEIHLDFIFVIENNGAIHDANNLIEKIGTKKFLKHFVPNRNIYFYNDHNELNEIFDIKSNKEFPRGAYGTGFNFLGTLKDPAKAKTYQVKQYLGSTKKEHLISDISYINDISQLANKNNQMFHRYCVEKNKLINKFLNEQLLKFENASLYETKEKDKGILIDLDNDGSKDLIASPTIIINFATTSASYGSLIIVYGDGSSKTVLDFGQGEEHLFDTNIIGMLDYNFDDNHILLIKCVLWESSYYILVNRKSNNIIFKTSIR